MTKSSKDSCATITPPDKTGHNLAAWHCGRKGKTIAPPLQGAGELLPLRSVARSRRSPPKPAPSSLHIGVVKQFEREGEHYGDENRPDKLRSPGDDHLRTNLRAQDLADPHR